MSKNLISQFQRDSKESAFSGIGKGHDDVGLESVLHRLMAMQHADGGGHVTTDDASNWDLSTARDGFMLGGGMMLFQAMMGGTSHQPLVDVLHTLAFGFLCAHTARLAIFGN